LINEIKEAVDQVGLSTYRPAQIRDVAATLEIIIAFGSAGTFTMIYRIISLVLQKDKSREINIKCGDKQLSLKGHSLPAEMELIKTLVPDLINAQESETLCNGGHDGTATK
jgi:hypothetical protein